jgi:DNA mismatch repair protein MutS2
VNGNTFRTLEFETIRALVLSHAGSGPGRARIEGLRPLTEPGPVREAVGRTSEGVALLRRVGRQPYHDLPDVLELLPTARVEGMHLEPRELADIASFIEGGTEIASRVARVEEAPRLAGRASRVADATALAAAIRRAVLPSGEVADDASPKLAETRRGLTRLKAQLQSVMESFLKGKDTERALQDKLITTRNDRYVLLLKAEQRSAIPGIIHGSSGSGASLFVEPMPAVELNNDIVSLQDEERQEVVRILRELTRRVGERAEELARAAEILGELDAVQAMALAAKDMGAAPAEVSDDGSLDLIDARHPLLMPSLSERLGIARRSTRDPVPVSLSVGGPGGGAERPPAQGASEGLTPERAKDNVLVISGPNTGGKTVALKTVGLLSLMAQCGLHIPAAPGSRLPVFRRIYADIGDEQSIAADLSTFSAHLASIVEMTRDLDRPALVLLDEVGAGTDPTEGGALGVAIVDHFRERGATVVATTHHGLMKAYAQSTPGVACASFGYDPQTYEPTYRLALGTAGRSLALEMAERLGLPAPVVKDARSRLDRKEAQAEALLKKLEEGEDRLRQEEGRIEAERQEVEGARAALRAAEAEAERVKRTELEAFRRELLKRGEEAARRAADAIQKAVQKVETSRKAALAAGSKARTEALADIRAAQMEALDAPALGLAPEPEAPAAAIAVGSRARVRDMSVVGQVMSLQGDEVELAVGGKRLRVPARELIGIAGPAPSRGAVAVSTRAPSPAAGAGASEVNLVGLTVDEALPRVDKALDDALLADRHEVRVIHGFGEGKLRKAVAVFLEGHPHVATVRLGAEGRGGVTVVELKE